MIRSSGVAALAIFTVAFLGCAPEPEEVDPAAEEAAEEATPTHPAPDDSPAQTEITASAELAPTDPGSEISGTAQFIQEAGGVRVVVEVSGLSPGEHGLHIHQNGTCADTGGHLDPFGVDHGCPPDAIRHLGDLGNVEVSEDGTGRYEQVVDKISLRDPHHQVAGKALVLHSNADDCQTQPTGGGGTHIACGVLTLDGDASTAGQGTGGGHDAPAADHEPPPSHG